MNRVGFIGGSDCVKIIQGDWLSLWRIKTGRDQPENLDNNLAVQLGRFTEDFNLAWFEKEHKVTLAAHQREFIETIGTVVAKGTIDAAVRHEANLVEAKHTNSFNNIDKLIDYYMPQLQLYCRLANAKGIYLSAIFGNSEWRSVLVNADNDYFNSMWAVVSDFWGYVLRDEEPIAVDIPQLSTEKVEVDNMVIRDASTDNQFIDAAITYIQGYEQNRIFEGAKKDLKGMVSDNEREVYCDYVTVKRDKRGSLRIIKR